MNLDGLNPVSLAIYVIPMAVILLLYIFRVRRQHAENLRVKE